MRLTVITPTIGRQSLMYTLLSVALQLEPGDEHIVIGDGVQPEAWTMCKAFGATYRDGPLSRNYGNTQRDVAAAIATGEYLMYCDDDDTFTPDALALVREAVTVEPGIPHLFRMRHPTFNLLWQRPALVPGNVGTPMFVVPNDSRLALWNDSHPDAYGADYRFIARTVANHGGRCGWQEGIVCNVGGI
jgi:glycosyltransferase involved in cell wall biosynthesis